VRVDLLMAGWGFVSADEEAVLEDRFTAIGVEGGFGDDMLRLAGIKLMPDGGIGDRTARLLEPYANEPQNRGQWVVEPARLESAISWVHERGWSMDIHT
ncbi:MAG: amidohydrolase, partial [Chloroflexota bacterium]